MPLEAITTGWWRRYLRWGFWPVAVWFVLLIGVLFSPLPLYDNSFNNDPDNYMRADQVRDWLDGSHDWYDTRQRRLDPAPDGVHGGADVYSRLVDLPLAAVALIAKPVVGLNNAILVAAFVVPFLLQLPLLLWLLGWSYRPLLGRASWGLAAISLVYPGLIGEFIPGRIDHHSYQIMLTIWSLGAMLRLWLVDADTAPRSIRNYGLMLGLALAFSLTIGVEALPWLGLLLGIVGYAVWRSPLRLQPAAIAFAVSVPVAATLLLIAFRTPAQFMQPTLYVMSLVSVKIALAAGLVAALVAYAAPRIADSRQRAVVMLGIAAAMGAILLADTPGLLHGPWLGFDPWLVSFTSLRASEMRPMIMVETLWPWVEGLGLIALGGYWYALTNTAPARRLLLWMLLALSAGLCLMTLFYAIRLDRFWFIASLPGLFYALQFVKAQGQHLIDRRPRLAVGLALLLAFAPLVILGLRGGAPLPADINAAADHKTDNAADDFVKCDICLAANFLNVAYHTPQRIMVYGTVGPELVWRTPHNIIGGGIYNNAEGLRAARTFIIQPDPKAAARILSDQAIDLVYIRDLPQVAAVLGKQTDDPYDRPLYASDPNAMIQRLQRGERFPWLVEIKVPFNTKKAFTLYRVDRDVLADYLKTDRPIN